jgi:hypothetical protein
MNSVDPIYLFSFSCFFSKRWQKQNSMLKSRLLIDDLCKILSQKRKRKKDFRVGKSYMCFQTIAAKLRRAIQGRCA